MVILLGFSAGLLTGIGIIYFARVLPLRLKLHKARNALSQQDAADLILPDD
jgi:capsular polysaccharide biosynthesis protein